jgi:anthranilate phosphoribosyltransferase
MGISQYIREIGRGKAGARSLTEPQAHDLMRQVLDGVVSDLEVGAFALAMRVKGETVDELTGFARAAAERCLPLPLTGPTIVMPSYNGARRLPNLTALLALMLAQEGINVLVHGPATDPDRVTTAEVFRHLGLPMAQDAADARHTWSRHEPVFIATEVWCPPLARLLDVRRVVGVRNSGHKVAKVLAPASEHPALRVMNHTHPEYAVLLAAFAHATEADAMLLRGTEGEPVADARRLPRLDVVIRGRARADLARPAQDGVLAGMPLLPREHDSATTANYIQAVVGGEKPAPAPLQAQMECLIEALDAAGRVQAPALIA